MLLTGLGVGAYYLVISLGTLDALLLLRREIDAPLVRAVGWCTSLVGLTTLAASGGAHWSPGSGDRVRTVTWARSAPVCWKRTSPRSARSSWRRAWCWAGCCSRPTMR